jgi:hypothetical protein
MRAWLDAAGIHRGPVFRRVRCFYKLGAERLSDQPVALIVNVTRHRNLPVLRDSIRAVTAFDDVGEVL